MTLNIFIDNLKRDKARGVIAPHQIVLLCALYNLFERYDKVTFDIEELNTEFQLVWKENKDRFQSISNILGMPLKALLNQGHVNLNCSNKVLDFRRLNNLKTNIKSVQIGTELSKIFTLENVKKTLINRLNK
ncbi:hypothetical protein [Sphingobacterium sp. MYb382]|uniref:hypothetical protein n=1 Tax=Sphingobacterium sp. MYb382 TaxID=2745278 RepID=UPI0030996E97